MTTKITRYELEDQEDWRGWLDKIPSLDFPKGWHVKIIPPFAGALVRFQVTTDKGGWSSIYLDVNEALGYFGEPYWEIYPYNGDTARCAINDTKHLMQYIRQSLEEREA